MRLGIALSMVLASASALAAEPLEVAVCAARLPAVPAIERCWLERGVMDVIRVEHAYHGECVSRVYLLDGGTPRALPKDIGWEGVAVLPSREVAIADRAGRLVRLDLTQDPVRERGVFARCGAPVLSPKRRFIVCRDLRGDVLTVPIAGGRPRVVWRPDGRWGPRTHRAVAFVADDTMEVPISGAGDWATSQRAPFSE